MKRVIYYQYRTFDLGCGCCSDSISSISVYDVYEDGKCVEWDQDIGFCESEYDLRKQLSSLEPFEVDHDSIWF